MFSYTFLVNFQCHYGFIYKIDFNQENPFLYLYLHSDGVVSCNEYMAFMISRETENVRSASEVEDAFRAITEGGKQLYVTEEELYQVIYRQIN